MPKDKDEASTASDDREPADKTPSSDQDDDSDRTPELPNRGERPDNLRRRSEWFEKRTGGR